MVVVIACLGLVACRGSGKPAATQVPPTSTMAPSTQPTVRLTPVPSLACTTPANIGPFSQAAAFANPHGQSYVLDIASGQVFAIGSEFGLLRWLDDRTLYTDLASRVVLDNDAPAQRGPVPTAEPRAGSSVVSADGLWRLVTDADGRARVESVTGEGRLDLPESFRGGPHAWSPAGHRLAIAGDGSCRDETLLLADPDAEAVTRLTLPSDVVKNFLWRPDGSSLAASLVTSAGRTTGRYEALLLGLDGSRTLLMPEPAIRLSDDLTLQAWNPSGTRLLFSLNFGRKC
jgi:hypothetical protein